MLDSAGGDSIPAEMACCKTGDKSAIPEPAIRGLQSGPKGGYVLSIHPFPLGSTDSHFRAPHDGGRRFSWPLIPLPAGQMGSSLSISAASSCERLVEQIPPNRA